MSSRVARKFWEVTTRTSDDVAQRARVIAVRLQRCRRLRDECPRWRWRERRTRQEDMDRALDDLCRVVGVES